MVLLYGLLCCYSYSSALQLHGSRCLLPLVAPILNFALPCVSISNPSLLQAAGKGESEATC